MTNTTTNGSDWPQDPAIWVGVNYWSRAGGPRMWARYDGDIVRQELAVLADHGCTLTRSFCYWPDFMPEPEVLDEEVMSRFIDFLDLHREVGLRTIPTFIVGHMSGENWDPAWREGRDLYRDVWLVAQQAWYVAEVARRTANHPAIAAWLLSNEMPIYGRNGDERVVTSWARLLVQALRSAGAAQPVSTGDGAWGIEVTGNDNGFSLRRLAPVVDFIGPHTYQASDDPVRQMLTPAFACELSSSFDKPVVLEEFGLSSDLASGENAAHYYRQVLHSSLLAGARGWLAWNNCDYDNLAEQDPYRHHPFEMHFGITDHAGRPKPQALELARFSALVTELSTRGWQRAGDAVAVVVPEHLERTEPSWSFIYRGDIRPNLFQSYIAAREADLPVALVRERDLLRPGGKPAPAQLYLLPCAKLMTAPGAQLMHELAAEGATVYASYFAGSGRDQVGPWLPWINQTFGVAHQLRYGVPDTVTAGEVTLELTRAFGHLAAGAKLDFLMAGEGPARAFLPVEPAGAEVLAVDGQGRPALLRNQVGKGSMVLCTYPLEHMAASRPAANPEPTWQLYSALADEAGVDRPVRVDDPRVVLGPITIGGQAAFLVLNVSAQNIDARVLSADPVYLAPSTDQEPIEVLQLGPYEVALIYSM
ncbi:MAG TPA: cellulase family glycosylhydrolase [Acidimicrobiales bacterium]|nr:cellulase family glycosylhydrolase [Acidimicrobiales bacterium]